MPPMPEWMRSWMERNEKERRALILELQRVTRLIRGLDRVAVYLGDRAEARPEPEAYRLACMMYTMPEYRYGPRLALERVLYEEYGPAALIYIMVFEDWINEARALNYMPLW